jgi:hypothetical protein
MYVCMYQYPIKNTHESACMYVWHAYMQQPVGKEGIYSLRPPGCAMSDADEAIEYRHDAVGRLVVEDGLARLQIQRGSSAVAVGSLVRIHGLVGRADLNDLEGNILSFDAAKGRFVVEVFVDISDYKVKTENVLIKQGNLDLVDLADPDRFSKRDQRRVEEKKTAAAQAPSDAPPLSMCTAVRIDGLQAKPQFNGRLGIVLGWSPASGRLSVSVAECGLLSLKAANCLPAELPPVAGTELLASYAVVNGDCADLGECSICRDNALKLVSPFFTCCAQSICNDCAVAYSDEQVLKRDNSCPFCRAKHPSSAAEALQKLVPYVRRGDPRAIYSVCASAQLAGEKDEVGLRFRV